MTPTQKRHETAQVDAYLRALEVQQRKLPRGRRTREWLAQHVTEVDAQLPEATGVKRLTLIQDRLDCVAELEAYGQADNIKELEAAFIKVAATYSERTGVSFQAWREVGVPASVLNEAGVPR